MGGGLTRCCCSPCLQVPEAEPGGAHTLLERRHAGAHSSPEGPMGLGPAAGRCTEAAGRCTACVGLCRRAPTAGSRPKDRLWMTAFINQYHRRILCRTACTTWPTIPLLIQRATVTPLLPQDYLRNVAKIRREFADVLADDGARCLLKLMLLCGCAALLGRVAAAAGRPAGMWGQRSWAPLARLQAQAPGWATRQTSPALQNNPSLLSQPCTCRQQ